MVLGILTAGSTLAQFASSNDIVMWSVNLELAGGDIKVFDCTVGILSVAPKSQLTISDCDLPLWYHELLRDLSANEIDTQ